MLSIAGKSHNIRLFLNLAWRMYHANNTFGNYHRYVKKVAKDTISRSHTLNDTTIPERIFKKINWYMVESLFMGEMLARLAGKTLTDRDKETLVYLGAIMALFDVFIDDFRFERVRVLNILDYTFSTDTPIITVSDTAIEKVYCLYLEKLLLIIEKNCWDQIKKLLSIIKLQTDSSKQFGSDITEDSILSITSGKGGVSALICSAFLDQKDELFREAVFETGGFIQMMNDCQDIHKDTTAGIKTFVHFRKDFRDIFDKLNDNRIKVFGLIRALDLPVARRIEFIFGLNAMFIVIAYKISEYAALCNYTLDFSVIKGIDKEKFRINPFGLKAVSSCFSRIMDFKFEKWDQTPYFELEKPKK